MTNRERFLATVRESHAREETEMMAAYDRNSEIEDWAKLRQKSVFSVRFYELYGIAELKRIAEKTLVNLDRSRTIVG